MSFGQLLGDAGRASGLTVSELPDRIRAKCHCGLHVGWLHKERTGEIAPAEPVPAYPRRRRYDDFEDHGIYQLRLVC
jgi:hypothetical protein